MTTLKITIDGNQVFNGAAKQVTMSMTDPVTPPSNMLLVLPGTYNQSNLPLAAGKISWASQGATINGDIVLPANTGIRGFTVNNAKIDLWSSNQSGVSGCTVAECIFNGGSPREYEGNIAMFVLGSTGTRIINNDFNNVNGNVVTGWATSDLTLSGNHFITCRQPINLAWNNDSSRGKNILIERNIFTGISRMAVETAGEAYTNPFVLLENWVDPIWNAPNDGRVAYSIILRNGVGTLISGNYAAGPGLSPNSQGIELAGPGEVRNNYIENFTMGITAYSTGFNIHNNVNVNVPTPIDLYGQPPSNGTVSGNTTTGTKPARPTRRVWVY